MAPQPVRAVARADGNGFSCGNCGSADDWFDTNTDVVCGNCGTPVPHDQISDFYDDDGDDA